MTGVGLGHWRRLSVIGLVTAGVSLGGCESPSALVDQASMTLVIHDLRPIPETDGTLEAWVVRGGDTVSVGTVAFPVSQTGPADVTHAFTLPFSRPDEMFVTVEPPGDATPGPSPFVMLRGGFGRNGADLSIEGVITDGRPLEPDPGAHSLFTTSNNVEFGYPSFEDAGLWLFSLRPGLNEHGTREVKVTPVRATWTYEGWAVHRHGTPDAVWVSYGKFRPDLRGLLSSRDDTGSGPYSGDEDFLNGGVEDVPGEEWVTDRIAHQLGVSLPPGVAVPFDLDAEDPVTGEAEWTHVITIEPAFDEGEPLFQGRPFTLRPYRNAIGAGGPGCREIQPIACPGDPRVIEFVEAAPTASVRTRDP
jgi:hypothetical protein